MKRLTPEGRRAMLAVLKAFYDAVAAEPVPRAIHDILRNAK